MTRAALTAIASLGVAALGAGGCGRGGGTSAGNGPPGKQVFADTGCGSCHTFAAAGSRGTVGPTLDARDFSVETAEGWVRSGGKGMPAYGSQLSAAQIRDVATFVAAGSQTP